MFQALPIGKIEFGEPDANVEYYASNTNDSKPFYVECFFDAPGVNIDKLKTGEKYIIKGQKGTGKTAILRYLAENIFTVENGFQSEFFTFKSSILDEDEIREIGSFFHGVSDSDLHNLRHYQHIMKRIIIFVCISKLKNNDISSFDDEFKNDSGLKSYVEKIANSSIGDLVSLAFNSAKTALKAASVKLHTDSIKINQTTILKSGNDDLIKYFKKIYLRGGVKPIRIFFDELHFAYRNVDSLRNDAMLVRDTVFAAQSLNESFAKDRIDTRVYVSIRSEYLEHPVISQADVSYTIESAGEAIDWGEFNDDSSHPLFGLIAKRFQKHFKGSQFSQADLFKIYLKRHEAERLLRHFWSRPRDVVRFFKILANHCPNKIAISKKEIDNCINKFAKESWLEYKSALSAFISEGGFGVLDDILETHADRQFDGYWFSRDEFEKIVEPLYENSLNNKSFSGSKSDFIRVLYVMGVIVSRKQNKFGEYIYHRYFRGNRTPHIDGQYQFHPTILHAFG